MMAAANWESGWVQNLKALLFGQEDAHPRKIHKISICYMGRLNDSFLIPSENVSLPEGERTMLGLLNQLRARGPRWAYELSPEYLSWTVEGKNIAVSEALPPGANIVIFSSRSIWEA
jgi:hypothetical protein